MRFVGIDVGAERHVVAAVDVAQAVVLKPTGFAEDAGGYQQMLTLLGPATDTLVAMEATGHYWKNLFAVLVTQGFVVALLNPLRTHRFAAEELQRTKTDAIDALGIARFAAQKRPAASRLPDAATEELRERLRYRDRLSQDFGDRERQLHRLLDLGFPEFPRYVRDVGSELATTILRHYPTAAAFQGVPVRRVAGLRYANDQPVGRTVATALLTAAATSVGQHHSAAYRLQVQDICEDLDVLRRRLRTLDRDIARLLERHEIGTLLTTIDGIGPQTAARLVATFGDFRGIRSGAALASYVGAIPGLRQSGKRTSARASLTPLGAARLRAKLYMPVLSAVRCNPWLRAYYEGLIARGKLPKVALIAAMRKLLHAVYSVATHRRPFVPHVLAQEGRP
jgi:transposase